jgi:hypothetical protein
MPYISKERREWMTLRQVITHIQHIDRCDEADALEQVRKALADGEITAHAKTHYKDSATDEFFEISFRGWRDPRWPRDKYWLSVPIKFDQEGNDAIVQPDEAEPAQVDDRTRGPHAGASPGAVTDAGHVDEGLDDGEDDEEGLDRVPYPLLFPRTAILDIWWEEPIAGEDEASAENKSGDLKQGNTSDIRDATRLLYSQNPGKPPNNLHAPRKIADSLAEKGIRVSRIQVRKVLAEKEFTSQRRLPGERYRKD